MLPPGPSTTGVNDARLTRARRWNSYNFAPVNPLAPTLPEVEPTEERGKALRDFAQALPRTDFGPAPPRARPELTRDTLVALAVEAAIGARNAVSRGPFGAPWRIKGGYIQQDNTAAGTGLMLTATDYDASGTTDLPVGNPLIDHRSLAVPAPGELGYWQESDIAQTSPKPIPGQSAIMPAGTFLTLWVTATTAAVSHAAACWLSIDELVGLTLSEAPDLELVLRRLRRPQPRPPQPRLRDPGAPRAVRITSAGFSRIIPWQLLAPELKREFIVNLANGKPTPGILPL